MAKGSKLTAERLAEAMDECGFDQPALANALGVSQPSISGILTGKTQNSRLLPRIADLLEVNLSWLLGSSDEKRFERNESYFREAAREMNSVLLPEIDLAYSMGHGSVLPEELTNHHVAFPREWLRPLIRGTFEDVFIAYAKGNSMEPTLKDGDVVIIDTAQKVLDTDNAIWCLALGSSGYIKRVRALPNGGYHIVSDNTSVEPQDAYDDEMQIVGRVIWIGRRA